MKRTKATANKFSKTATLLGENIKKIFAKDDQLHAVKIEQLTSINKVSQEPINYLILDIKYSAKNHMFYPT